MKLGQFSERDRLCALDSKRPDFHLPISSLFGRIRPFRRTLNRLKD
jgi:hypothetical protein